MALSGVTSSIEALVRALEQAWDHQTSADPDWSPEFRSKGQCAVSALVIQDELGGDLLRAIVDGVSHYWNRLPDGSEVDATRSQFVRWAPADLSVRDRGYVLSFPDTGLRYAILRCRIDTLLKAQT
jgi:hypothetical protein